MQENTQNLRERLVQITDKKERIRAIHNLIWAANDVFPEIGVIKENQDILHEAFELATELNDKWGLAFGYINKAHIGLYITQDPNIFNYFKKGLELFQEIGEKELYTRASYMMTYSLWMMGKYDEALQNAIKGLKSAEADNDPHSLGWTNYALGVFHFDLKDYTASENYYKRAYQVFNQYPDKMKTGIARCKGGLGSIMIATGRLVEALENIQYTVESYRETKNVLGESRALTDIGSILALQEKYEQAEKYLKQGLALRDTAQHHQGTITSCMELGRLYIKMHQYNYALDYLNRALELALTSDTKPKIFQIHELIGEAYKQTGNLKKALEHKEKFFQIKTEVTGEQASNRLKQLQTEFATEKSEKEAEIHRLKNVELKKAYEEIEEKNKNILDSINYAKRIQQAILPSDAEIKKLFPESFVLYQPKDVVSGDFYWIESKNGTNFIAAVDCTGHGVPGAFMSMIGNTLLNEIVNDKGITTPNEILSHLRESIIKSLKQTGNTGENQDGMDIALCAISSTEMGKYRIDYAGAHNPLWILKNPDLKVQDYELSPKHETRNYELIEYKADKQPIGIFYGEVKPFTNHMVELEKGNCIYLFTDGYADQAGGEKGKKFMYKRLQELITNNYHKNMDEQKTLFSNTINEWKGTLEQVDDILLIGIRL